MTFTPLKPSLLGATGLMTGLECEGVRVASDGSVSSRHHPALYGNKLENPSITVDFAEPQIEIITPPRASLQATYDFARALRAIVMLECREHGELLWPCSTPPRLPDRDDRIHIAQYDSSEQGRAARAYREKLAAKYGRAKQMFSGVHFNFSYEERLLDVFGGRNAAYLKVARNFMRYGWLLALLFGATPELLADAETGAVTLGEGMSVRNGAHGYRNDRPLSPSLDSVEAYCRSVRDYINEGVIQEAKELYEPLRLKPADIKDPLTSLETDGILYLEIRALDLNPFEGAGIARGDLAFLHAFALFLLLEDETHANHDWRTDAHANMLAVADHGLNPETTLRRSGRDVPLLPTALEIIDEIGRVADACKLDRSVALGVDAARARVAHPETLYAARMGACALAAGSKYEPALELARAHTEAAYGQRWLTPGYEEWEMSTQLLVKEALTQGISVDPIDRGDNLIRLSKGARTTYVEQATKTDRDTYITPLLMNNKTVTKRILSEHDLRVPYGEEFDRAQMRTVLERYLRRPVVVKPKDTNFGLGVALFPRGAATYEKLKKAAEACFEHSKTALVEEYIPGPEYRFLVIDGACVGVLHRSPASVRGDGSSTITELVASKNRHPYRSTGYRTPLISLQLGEVERAYLASHGKYPETIPAAGETIVLRPNSNISTGGESIDFTDTTADVFKEVAVRAAAAFDATFCGVDIIVEDITDAASSYAIIEANFNPAIHIHSFPAQGTERNIAALVLRALKFPSTRRNTGGGRAEGR